MSRCCVQNVTNKDKHPGTYEDSKRSERREKFDGWGLGHLKRLVKDDTHLNATKIVSNLNASFAKTCNNTSDSYLFERTGL